VLRILWTFVKQVGALILDILVVVLAVAGISILVKYLGKAMILALPLVVLIAGVLLLSLARMRKRARDQRERAAAERSARR
jgi:general stress protein CsbA